MLIDSRTGLITNHRLYILSKQIQSRVNVGYNSFGSGFLPFQGYVLVIYIRYSESSGGGRLTAKSTPAERGGGGRGRRGGGGCSGERKCTVSRSETTTDSSEVKKTERDYCKLHPHEVLRKIILSENPHCLFMCTYIHTVHSDKLILLKHLKRTQRGKQSPYETTFQFITS